MQIQHITWQEYHIPFRRALTTGHGTTAVRSGAIIQVETDNGITGRGDLAPLPEFGTGDLASNLYQLRQQLPAIADASVNATCANLAPFQLPPPAQFALETALLDAMGQERGIPLHTLLSGDNLHSPKHQIAVNGLIGILPLSKTVQAAGQLCQNGYQTIKLKVQPHRQQTELRRIAAVRRAIGPAISLRIDANGSWSLDEARAFMNDCQQYAIEYIEQPLPPEDIDALARLHANAPIRIAADESAVNAKLLRELIRRKSVDILVLKPTCLGGLQSTIAIIDQAISAGIQCVLSSAFETGIGLAALAHLAAVANIHAVSGLATLPFLMDDLIGGQLNITDGKISVPQGPGIGVAMA